MLQHSVCVAPLKHRHWGEEQLKRVWEGKHHTRRLHWFHTRAGRGQTITGCESGGAWCDFNSVQTRSDTILYSLKTLTSWRKKKRRSMALDPLTVRSQTIWNNKRDTFATVHNSGERSSPVGEAAPLMCAKKQEQNKKNFKCRLKASRMISMTWQRTSKH